MSQQTCVIYCRISKDRVGAGLGVARQEKDCRALAKRMRWPVEHVYVDNDISAHGRRRKRRPEYEDMLDDIREGHIHRVITWHTDRLHRWPRELEDYIDASEMHNCETHTVKAGIFDLSTPSGRAIARTLAAWATFESEHKSDRIRAKHKELADAGVPVGGLRPYGWHSDRTRINIREQRIIRECADRLLAGESLRSVAADLNRRDIKTVTGKPWSPTVVRSMLIRPRMAGLRAHNGTIVGPGKWEPALDEQTWRELVAMFTDPARRTGTNTRRYLLTGIAICDVCEKPVTIQIGGWSRPAGSRVAYGCRTCGVWRAQPAVDAHVEGTLVGRLEKLDLGEPTPDADPAVVEEIESVRRRLDEATSAFVDDPDVSPDQLRFITRRLRARLAELERGLVPPRRRRLLEGLVGRKAAEAWEALGLDRQRAVLTEVAEVRVKRANKSAPRTFDPSTVTVKWR